MPLFAESEEKIFGDILFDVVESTNISRVSPGSKTRALAQATSKKLGRMWAQFDLNMVQAFLSGASGRYLSFIGDMMGVERLGERPAAISASDRIIKLFVDVGTFGDINSGQAILIPSGTIISTLPGGEGVKYRIPFSVILSIDSSEFYIPVESLTPGESANVGTNTLVYHTFNDYSDSINDTLKVTNEVEINLAASVESDANFQFRIANQVLALENANETAIRLATLIVPGVADLVSIPFNRGIGTFDLMIKSTVPSVSKGLLDAVRESVSKVTSQGIVPIVRGPIEIGMSLVGTLIPRRTLSASEETVIINAVTDNITNYINNLDIGEEFIVNEVVERTLSTSDLIKNIGTSGQPLDKLFIHRPSRLEDNKIRETLTGDFDPEADERLIVETKFAGSTPILFRISQ